MAKYTVAKGILKHDAAKYKTGDTVELSDKIAKPLIKNGILKRGYQAAKEAK